MTDIQTPAAGTSRGTLRYALFFDRAMESPTVYHERGDYFQKAKDRMDRTYELIAPYLAGKTILDIGASPFYLLYRALHSGAKRCHGVYFSNDTHPLRGLDAIHSDCGPIELSHSDIESEPLRLDNDSVDVVTACEILEHCDSFPFKILEEIRRVLKPGGILCITVPNVCSIANILKLVLQKNIYYKYRSDPTGRHRHEYTATQLKALVEYLGFTVVKAGFLPSPTSKLFWLRPAYRAIAVVPLIRKYSPVLYIVARQPSIKSIAALGMPPPILYDDAKSIEE